MANYKNKIKGLAPCGNAEGAGLRYIEYKNLLLNAIEIKATDDSELPFYVERLIKDQLIDAGQVGFDTISGYWAKIATEGRNEYGQPLWLVFTLKNGKTFRRPACYEPNNSGAYIIRALPDTFALSTLIKETTDFMEVCETAIRQNVEATKAPYIIVAKKEQLLSVEHFKQQKLTGEPIIVVSEDLGEGLQAIDIKVEYIADKINTLKGDYRDKLLNKLGIMSANTDKRERVQVGEVNATVGQCNDYIYMLIDTFNKQAQTYGLPYEMVLNGSLEELYEGKDGEYSDDFDKEEDTKINE